MNKNFSIFRIFLFSVFLIIAASCSKYSFTTGILVPADITVSQDIQTVGILNRSMPEKSNWLANLFEGFISGESIFADREGSMNTIRGAANTLNVNPRFRAVLMEGEDFRGTGTKQFPIPLDWQQVDQLCKKYNVDGLVSLETFDSDIFLRTGSRERTRKEKGENIKYIEYSAELRIVVNSGWRFYDNVNKRLIDQQIFHDEKMWSGTGLNPDEALRKLPSKRRAINQAGVFAGEMLAFRISPKWLTASRTLYKKGGGFENFTKTKHSARVKNWEEIITLMDPLTRVSDNKVAARACHNTAIAFEMEGELLQAKDWAMKAYNLHKKSIYRGYVNELNTRIMDQDRLKEQLEGK
jgi:hypothetical protein